MVGPAWSPSAVWLKTTSRMTSMPARCSAFTMSRNSSTAPERIPPRAVGLVRREERHRRVAPVVDESRRRVLRVELEHRQQLHRGDAERLQVRNLLDQSGVGAALSGRDAGARMLREAAHVHLVNDGLRGRTHAAARRPPSRSATDRRPRSSSRCGVVARPLAPRRGRSPPGRRRRGRTDRAAPCRDRIAVRARGSNGPSTR